MSVNMYRITCAGKFVGNIRESDLKTFGDVPARARYELALMVPANQSKGILNGIVTQYSDGSISIVPRDSRGKIVTDKNGNRQRAYFFTPYVYE